jgi:hypothetical protein
LFASRQVRSAQPTGSRLPAAWWILAACLLLGGLAVRLYDLTDPPLDFHPTRQLHSLIMARGMFYQEDPAIPADLRQLAVTQWKAEGIIEPPFLEHLVAFTYRLAGQEIPWAGRIYSIIFWVTGSIGLLLLGRELFNTTAALVALGFYLLLPFAVYASRSFQPDPLMTAVLVFSWWAFARWLRAHTWGKPQRRQAWGWAILAGLFGAAAILVKGTVVFLVAGVWLGGVLAVMGLRRALRDPQTWALAALTLLPFVAYTLYGVLVSGVLQDEFSLRFFPSYWIDPAFYLRWYNQLVEVFSLPWLALALLGLAFLPSRISRGILWGGWAGYLLMGFGLSHHITTHSYYHLPLIPLAGLGVAALASAILRSLPEPRRVFGALAALVMLGTALMSGWEARTTLKRVDYHDQPAFWQGLVEKMGQGASVAGITQDYGYRLEYWGWITPSNWLTSAEFDFRKSVGQTFDLPAIFKDKTANKEYFLVTMLDELDRQPELKAMLEKNYPIFARGPGYVIYYLLPENK